MKAKWNNIHLIPIITILIGIGSTLLSSINAEDFWKFFGLLLIIVLTSLLVGVFFGFLFGIPKLNKQFNPTTDYAKKNKYKPNTNLEEISDWLTKIIVGVSLTQAIKIPNYLESLAHSILAYNKCLFICNYAQAIIIALIILFTILGFLIGYFYTRIYLPNLFSIMEGYEQQNKVIQIIKEGYDKVITETMDDDNVIANLARTKFSDLSFDEQNILTLIYKSGNKYLVPEDINVSQSATIEVLLIKRIIEIVSGGTSGYGGASGYWGTSGASGTSGYSNYVGSTLRIIDKKLLLELKKQ